MEETHTACGGIDSMRIKLWTVQANATESRSVVLGVQGWAGDAGQGRNFYAVFWVYTLSL